MFVSSKRGRMGAAGLALLLALTGTGGASASAASGTSGHWADSILNEWQSRGLLKGDENGALQGGRVITRAEFVTMANRAFQLTAPGDARFKDVKLSAWYASDVDIAAQAGYISGYEDGTVRPEQPVTRQEAAVMLAAIAKKLGADQAAGTGEARYSDVSSIGKWSLPSVGIVSRLQVMTGYSDGTFGPNGKLTRSEAVVAMDRLMKLESASSDVVYDQAGTYGSADKTTVIEGDAVVRVSGVTLQNVHVKGDLILEKGIGEGDATLDGVTVDGQTTVAGGGEHSVHLIDSRLGTVTIDKAGGGIRLVTQGTTRIEKAEIRSPANLELGAGTELQTLLVYAVVTQTGDGQIVYVKLYVSGAKFEHPPEQVDKAGDFTYEAGSESGASGGTGGGGSSGGSPGGDTGHGDTGGGIDDPAPTVTGVTNGETITAAGGVTPISADTDIDTVMLTKDSDIVPGYALGTRIAENGSYALTVTDQGGHSTTISFTVNIPSSPVRITVDPDSIKSENRGLTLHFDIANNGDSIDHVVNGVRLNVPGVDGDTLTGWDGGGYIDFKRVGASDDFVGTFPSTYDWDAGSFVIQPYTLESGTTHGIDFSIQLGEFTEPKTVKVRFWIADASQPDEGHALYAMDELVLPLEANYTPLTDLEVVATTDSTVTLQSTFPSDADGVSIGYGFKAPDEGRGWDWSMDPDLADIQFDEQTGKVRLTLTMLYPGYSYYLQMIVSGGKYDGPSNVVRIDLQPLIENVADGETYTEPVTPSAFGDYDSVALMKDGVEIPDYAFGTSIDENGEYTLTVKDHEQSTTVHFTIAIPRG